MEVRYSPSFYRQYKKADVRIRNRVDEHIRIFRHNPIDPQLDNHVLQDEYFGYRSIDITADWRAIYKETVAGDSIVAYFVVLGTHEQLYRKSKAS